MAWLAFVLVGPVSVGLVLGAAVPVWAAEIPEVDALPLFLLGLLATLMIFRLQSVLRSRGADKTGVSRR